MDRLDFYILYFYIGLTA